MVLQKLCSGSVEAAIPFTSSSSSQDLLCDWVAQQSRDFYEIATPDVKRKRRRLAKNHVLAFPVEPDSDDAPVDTTGCKCDFVEVQNPTTVLKNYMNETSTKALGSSISGKSFQSCKLCGKLEDIAKMLLCDNCEEAFHLSCCDMKKKMLPIDEWFCGSCLELDDRVSLDASFLNSRNIGWRKVTYKSVMGPIASMLKYPEPYTSRVRIGELFQASVPDWSCDIIEDHDHFGEPVEMDTASTISSSVFRTDKHTNPDIITNWLQCQEILDHHDARDCNEGTICGKWRRAPLSEVQTDEWDCSCAIVWDPSHADCAVPEELETENVMQQLKYIEQLRSRLAAKKDGVIPSSERAA